MRNEFMSGAPKQIDIYSVMAKQLITLERYERLALSRRKFAIRAFDLAYAQTRAASPNWPSKPRGFAGRGGARSVVARLSMAPSGMPPI
jgi:hypothetical protein